MGCRPETLQVGVTIQLELSPTSSYMTGGYAYPFINVELLNTILPYMQINAKV